MKTAILIKGGMVALLGFRPYGDSYIGIQVDPRRSEAVMTTQDTLEIAERNFNASVARSVKRGWRLLYAGAVNRG